MTIEIGPNGVVVPAEILGPLLDVAPADVPNLMRDGEITSRLEAGADEDAGRHRLTFWYGGLRLRLTIDGQGDILTTTRVRTKP